MGVNSWDGKRDERGLRIMNSEDVFTTLETIETERVLLREMRLADANDLFEYASDPEVSQYTSWETHQSIEDTKDFVKTVIEAQQKKQVRNWCIELKAGKKAIGACGFVYWDIQHSRAAFGYALARKYWNQGIMTEAMNEVIAFGFHQMKLNRIEAICEIENIGSFRVMEKLGMQNEGLYREYVFKGGRFRDVKMYSILKKDYAGFGFRK